MKRYYVSGPHTWLIVCTDNGLWGVVRCLEAASLPAADFDTVRKATLAELKENYQGGWTKLVDWPGGVISYPSHTNVG